MILPSLSILSEQFKMQGLTVNIVEEMSKRLDALEAAVSSSQEGAASGRTSPTKRDT